ncbi:MAG: hypothetical protein ACRDYZ_06705 [Acidimicrobiales bacterium]
MSAPDMPGAQAQASGGYDLVWEALRRIEVAFALGPTMIEPDVRLVWDPPWTPARLSDEAGAVLGYRRR